MFRTLIVLLLGIVIGLLLSITKPDVRSPKNTKYRLVTAQPPVISRPQSNQSCVQATKAEKALLNAAVHVLEFPANDASFLGIGAQRLLANGVYRRRAGRSMRVCDPAEIYERAGELIGSSDHLRRGRITEYGLTLIAKLPKPDIELVEIVAASAFNKHPQQSEMFKDLDIRPLARSVLASLGHMAKPYGDKAFELISISDALGTGAAQVAVASGHPMALSVVERLMREKLDSIPLNEAVSLSDRDRLYEMSYALYFGGADARSHLRPLFDLMKRKVQSWAPPFGMVELDPRKMCFVLAAIQGTDAEFLEIPYCTGGTVREQ